MGTKSQDHQLVNSALGGVFYSLGNHFREFKLQLQMFASNMGCAHLKVTRVVCCMGSGGHLGIGGCGNWAQVDVGTGVCKQLNGLYILCLQDPQKAIPKGTLLAIILTNITYLGMAILAGTVVIRNAPGAPADYFSGNDNCTVTSNDSVSYFIASAGEMMCGVTPFNIMENFPACAGADIEVVEGGACYPSSCLYEDSSRDNLQTLCNGDFLRLVLNRTGGTDPTCEFGLLNNFQVCHS